ncbi:MAG: hypothetical protein E7017_01305 [Alphaproteobacteria bacterium]|nr:hypothetical protein [Alphaproteobacteria bacterium]
MKRMIMIAVLGMLVSISNLFAAMAVDSSAVVNGKYVTYAGDVFEISVFNQEDAEKIITNARAVYAFQVADCNLSVGPRGNTSDHNECFKNSKTGEYAVESWYKKDGKYIYSYIIFSLNGARVENTLPEGFEMADYEEIYLVGYGQKAGWSTANLNGVHNSIVVFIK